MTRQKCQNKRVLTPEQALDTKSPLPHSKLWGITINKRVLTPEQALDTKSPLPHSKLWGITINKKENEKECPCEGICCECISYHRKTNSKPACMD